MFKYHSLLISAQELLISIVESRLNCHNHLLQESDSDVEMSDVEFFDEPVLIGLRRAGISRSERSETRAGVVRSHHPRI